MLPKRLPKQPIYVHIDAEDPDFNQLTGKFSFHSVRNNAAAFIRDGKELETFDSHPYYLVYIDEAWYIQNKDFFDNYEDGGWLRFDTQGLGLNFRL